MASDVAAAGGFTAAFPFIIFAASAAAFLFPAWTKLLPPVRSQQRTHVCSSLWEPYALSECCCCDIYVGDVCAAFVIF